MNQGLERTDYDPFLGITQVATLCGVTAKTVTRWLARYQFPPPVQAVPRGRLRWKQSTIEHWLESRTCKAPVAGR